MDAGKRMRVVLSVFSGNEQILHVQKILESLGCEVAFVPSDSYRQVCSYGKKKLDEMGFHGGKRKYLQSVRDKFHHLLQDFRPDMVLFVNTPKDILTPEEVKEIGRSVPTIGWFVDGIEGRASGDEGRAYLDAFHRIYVFEHGDVAYLQKQNIEATYLPVGYNDAFSHVERAEKSIDILFIGSPFYPRREILEKVAEAASQHHWNLKIIGPFYDEKYPWKRFLFKRKFPYIYQYLENGRVSSEAAAKLYAKTKVCLNIHDPKHKSPNPRTFEILAAGSFELTDERAYWGLLTPGKDVVGYENTEDLIEKLKIYLRDDAAREMVAASGKARVVDQMSMKNLLRRILMGEDSVESSGR